MNAAAKHDVSETVLEVLSALLAPELRARVLAEALALEGSTTIPDDPVRVRAFVEGPLRLVVKRRVGPMLAGLLLETMSPVFSSDRAPHELTVIGEEPVSVEEELTVIGEEDEESEETDVYAPGHFERLRARIRATSVPGPNGRFRTGQSGVVFRGQANGTDDDG